MKINTNKATYPKKLNFFFIRIWHFVNVYKPSHIKSHFSKKKNKHIVQKDNHFL